MNQRFVEAFYWVATLKSMTRAAEKLFMTQSAISSRVSALEEELGVLLIDRRDRQQFALTNAGLRFLSYAERLMTLHRQMRDELGTEDAGMHLLRVGAIESALHTWLIPMLQHLRSVHANLQLELTVEITPVLAEAVKRGSLDLVFAAQSVSAPDIRTRPLPTMEMVFVGAKALKRRAPWTLAEIVSHEMMTFQRGSQPHLALLEQLRSAGLEPPRLHTVSSIPAMVQLIESGFGIATLPAIAAQTLVQRHEIAVLPCETALAALPVQASYRYDPGSSALTAVIQDALKFIDGFGVDPARTRARGRSNQKKIR
ncbi:LysR family transcriptional regulator [Scleromatobacter humisilvae]|uniref:LysR family transcriptional regulator n=1 Tax=Scleromatobacter humisilvae TaxID=2897159 RepID=A0A9X1YMS9_9BURK|nr:LysR family transcriptional regulator [Scleromatobacter humisilvae]MCK9687628.1 LysR family transcriptional regulator [Scleromatobacter humisilvae]